MTSDKPKEWSKSFPLPKWWYNTSFHCPSKMTPFKVDYGCKPPTYTSYIPGETSEVAVDQASRDCESLVRLLKEDLL